MSGSDKKGYRIMEIRGSRYFIHRVAWAIYNNRDPGELVIDHINRVRHDNRIDNLRAISVQENNYNRPFADEHLGAHVTVRLSDTKTVVHLQPGTHVNVVGILNGEEVTLTLSMSPSTEAVTNAPMPEVDHDDA